MDSLVLYFTGGIKYSLPSMFLPTYALVQLRFLLGIFLLTVFLEVDYSVAIMVISVLAADLRFYLDYIRFIDSSIDVEEDEY